MDPAEKRKLMNTLFGETTRKVFKIFNENFMRSIDVFSQHSDRIVLDMVSGFNRFVFLRKNPK